MVAISQDAYEFFHKQGFVIVSTKDPGGTIHNSCKGIVRIDKNGSVYLLDLYQRKTFENLKNNSAISITAVDEHKFSGYCLKGKGTIVVVNDLAPEIVQAWEDRINNRISQRLIKNIRGEQGHPRHPEASFPKPQYMIEMEVEEIVDLTPAHLK